MASGPLLVANTLDGDLQRLRAAPAQQHVIGREIVAQYRRKLTPCVPLEARRVDGGRDERARWNR